MSKSLMLSTLLAATLAIFLNLILWGKKQDSIIIIYTWNISAGSPTSDRLIAGR